MNYIAIGAVAAVAGLNCREVVEKLGDGATMVRVIPEGPADTRNPGWSAVFVAATDAAPLAVKLGRFTDAARALEALEQANTGHRPISPRVRPVKAADLADLIADAA